MNLKGIKQCIVLGVAALAVLVQARAGGGKGGDVDMSFIPPPMSSAADIRALALTDQGQVYAGGYTGLSMEGALRSLVRLNGNGSLDSSFVAGRTESIGRPLSLDLDPEGRVLVATRLERPDLGGMEFLVWRLLPSGAVDPAFGPVSVGIASSRGDTPVLDLISIVKADGRGGVFVGGSLPSFLGHPGRLLRFKEDGSLDTGFTYGGSLTEVAAIAFEADGRLLVGGASTRVERLSADGAKEFGFTVPDFGSSSGRITQILVKRTGEILVAGPSVQQFLANGTVDPSFTVPEVSDVVSAALGPNETIVYAIEGSVRRLLASGIPDPAFLNATVSNVQKVAVAADGKIVLGRSSISFPAVARLLSGYTSIFSFVEPEVEGEEDTGTAHVTVRRAGAITSPASVNITRFSGSAVQGEDFLESNTVVEFAAGEQERTVELVLVNDRLPEREEQFSVSLDSTLPVALGEIVTCNVVIPANDAATTSRFAGSYRTMIEVAGSSERGIFSATVTRGGKVSGKLILGTRTLTLKGKLKFGSLELNWPSELGQPAVSASLWLDEREGSVRLLGEVRVEALAEPFQFTSFRRSVFKRGTPFEGAGRYTAALGAPASTRHLDEDTLPQGWSWLLIRARGNGNVRIVGRLGDSTPFSASGWLADDGTVSFRSRLYRGFGEFRVQFAFGGDETAGTLTGSALWLKPFTDWLFYINGFEHSGDLTASLWQADTAFPVATPPSLLITAPAVTSEPLTLSGIRRSRLNYGNRELTIDRPTGRIYGRVPGGSDADKFQGVWLMDQQIGLGASTPGQSVPVEVSIVE